MTPDPRILGAKSVEQLMEVLCAAPYSLNVPLLADLPTGTTLPDLWRSSITVTANEGACSYLGVAQGPWTLMLNLTIPAPIFCLADFGAPAPRGTRSASPRTTSKRRERSRR
jgi:hypothetical protein